MRLLATIFFAGLLALTNGTSSFQEASSSATNASELKQTSIRILVFDGKSGKPFSGRVVKVSSLSPKDRSALRILEGKTDEKGVFSISAPLPDEIAVHVKDRFMCKGPRIGTSVRRLKQIVDSGVSEPNLCNPKVQRAAKAGELVLYIRRESLREFFDF
jgi:hypothetical protein